MLFELCNILSNFQSYINKIICEYLDFFCSVYLNDILIYSENEQEYTEHVLKILHQLQEQDLHLDIDKCEFDSKKVKYLDLIITFNDIEMNSEKIEVIQN